MAVPASSASQSTYYAAFDGLRGVFFLCILTLHVLEVWNHLPLPAVLRLPYAMVHWAWFAVDMFFVLSGFLITGVLLQMRGVRYAIRTFYFRRALRIFPPYYLLLAALAVWMVLEAGSIDTLGQPAHLSYWVYLQNIFISRQGWDEFRPLSHLWSLAVEEQFYLLWPLLVLMMPLKRLRWILVGLFFMTILLRIAMVLNGEYPVAIYVLLFTRLDDLAAGSLIAMLAASESNRQVLARLSPYAMAVGLATIFLIWAVRGRYWLLDPVVQMFGYTANLVFAVGLMSFAAFREHSTLIRMAFINKPMVWLGMRSYAAYLFHFPLAIGFQKLIERQGIDPLPGIALTFVLTFASTLITAELSWRYWERPWLSLRKWYQPGKKAGAATAKA